MKRLKHLLPLTVLLMALLACRMPWMPNTPPEDIIEEIIETEPPLNVTVVVEPSCPADMIEGLAFTTSFCYPSALASGFAQEILPERPPSPEGPLWDMNPTTIEIRFTDYILPETFHIPAIRIYPVDDFSALDPFVGETITDLQGLLAAEDPDPERVPFLPVWNAAQMMQAKVQYFEFQNGRGMRFITQYGQAALPINNESAFYAFIGITDDGQFLLSGVLPVSHPLFYPDAMAEPEEGWDNFAANYESYIDDLETTLAEEPPESFLPSLGMLDAMMESFLIPPDTLP